MVHNDPIDRALPCLTQLDLSGEGASYIRVSGDHQETERQETAIENFIERYEVNIRPDYRFKDEGWARDTADRRPAFQRLMKLVQEQAINWIVVDRLDRFGWKSSKQLMHFLYLLEESGCRLYGVSAKEWTAEDDATEITALIEGKNSVKEVRDKSYRALSGMVEKAQRGEWLGGPVRLGFDVACFSRAEPDKELWRVVLEGRDKRRKVFPDGRAERFDDPGNFPKHQDKMEMLRLTPSKDRTKIDVAIGVFKRFAAESISFAALGHWVSNLGFRTCFRGHFQGNQIEALLRDPIYMGYYTWNREHNGKFHRYKGGQTILELNYSSRQTRNEADDWIQSHRPFEPLLDRKTWDAAQKKLGRREQRKAAPRSFRHYLSRLVVYGHCGAPMAAGLGRHGRLEYFCSTYFKFVREKRRGDSSCLRNGVPQDVLEDYIKQYLEETGVRLDLLTQRQGEDKIAGKLEAQQAGAWKGLCEGLNRLCSYLMTYHPAEYAALLEEELGDSTD